MSTPNSQIKCQSCGAAAEVDFAKCLRSGWPECCGSTMELLSTQANIEHAVGEVVGDRTPKAIRAAQHLAEDKVGK